MALTEEEKQDLLNAIRQESTGIDELETAENLDGLTSLPAMSGDKLVRAPIALLSKPAADAAQDARTAAGLATAAAGNADTAATAAGSAARNAAEKAREADEAAKKALLAAESVNGYIGTVDVQELDALSAAEKAGVYKVTENKNAAGWLLVHTDGGGHQVTQTLISNYTDGSGGTLDFTTHRDDAVTVYTRHYNIGSATLDDKETARGAWTAWTETGGTNLAEGLASTVAALAKETKERKDADTELQTAIDEETTAREEADTALQAGVDAAKGGASARFKGWLNTGEILQMSTTATGGHVVFVEDKGRFAYNVGGRLYNNWGTADMYMDAARQHPLEDKVYLYGYAAWVWKAEDATLVKASGAGGGAYDVTREIPLPSGYYTLESAVAALQGADIAEEDKPGFLMTFEYAGGKWADYRFNNYDTGNFDDPDCWEAYGGGRIRRITLNGKEVTPGADGEVDLRVNDVTVDESLAADSTNPVQNKAVTARLEEIGDAAVGGVEVIEDGDKNTLNILNKKGGVIASTEFTGGSGGGASTASRIVLTASVDKAQVKEGGTARLSYTYNHVNAEGAGDGVKADITVTVSRGTTQTYSQTVKGVGAGTYTLDISDYLLVGTTEIYVKAEAVTEDGTRQTKQAYVSVNVVTLTLVSGYNLGTAMQQGGYHDGDTVEIPFSITGSGTKDISMYLDGGETPTTQTISKSGTVNGSFSIAASSLSAGLHSVQLVAERDGLRSDSIYMEILKAGKTAEPFVGVKYTDTAGTVQTGAASPRLSVAQYGTLRFHYVAYDPDSTVAQVEISVDGQRTATVGAPRTMQEYTNRMTERGSHTVTLRVGKTEREMAVEVTANEPYAFGYGTNNSPNIQNTGIIGEGETAELSITGAYTVNDPLRLYGASRVRVLDMTGAADHLKNGLDLGKCGALRELNLESENDGSTGWWLVLGGCKSLRRLNVRDQRQAKTGGSTSKELDLTGQTKLEWLDARGTQVESVVLAQGAPVTEAHLPATIRTLRLEYLPKLTDAGLTMEGRESVETFVFAGCPNMDWEEQLRKCANVRRVRVTGIDITDGNGSLLNKYMGTGGVDADGNTTETCGLVGTYRLRRYADAERIAAWRAHYPELDIRQPEYTLLLHDDTVADPANVTNLDNNTGYDYGTAYEPSGHVSEILSRRHRVLAKNTGLGKNTVCRLHDRNSFYFADAEKTAAATPALLAGDMGDFMMDEPRYWFKGVNDLVNRKKYSAYSTREDAPKGTHASRRLTLDEVATHATETAADGITVLGTVAEAMVDGAAGYNVMSVEVAGWARVRWPSVAHAQYGAVMADAEGNIVRRVKAAVSSGIADGEYVFADVPAGAVTLYFTIKRGAPFDYVLLTQSVKPEDIEEDWVLHERMLRSVVPASNVTRANNVMALSDSNYTADVGTVNKYASRGKGYCMMDYEAWRDMALLFMAKYGTRDLQGTCGRGRFADVPTDWCKYGMQDTVADNSDSDGWSLITNADGVTERVGCPAAIGYYMPPRFIQRTLINIPLAKRGNSYGKPKLLKFTRLDGTEVEFTLDGTDVFVSLLRWGRHCDILPSMLLGSGTTHTCDEYLGYSSDSGYILLYLGHGGSSNGFSFANQTCEDAFGLFNFGVNYSNSCRGSYLLFRGDIEETDDVEAFKEMQEI